MTSSLSSPGYRNVKPMGGSLARFKDPPGNTLTLPG